MDSEINLKKEKKTRKNIDEKGMKVVPVMT